MNKILSVLFACSIVLAGCMDLTDDEVEKIVDEIVEIPGCNADETAYNYDKDECIVKVNDNDHVEGNNDTLDKLVDGLSNSMVGLSWEDCQVGEELTVNPNHL